MGANIGQVGDGDDTQLKGATDSTLIGNVGDSLKTNVTASALPTGASTSTLQTTGNTSLASIDTKTPALGQALAAASVPIVLTAAQLTTLTPLTSVTVTQATGTNLHTVVDSSALPTGAATSANQSTQITSLQLIDDVPTAPNAAIVKGSPLMGQLDDTSTVVATEDNASVARITAQRALHANIRNNAGTEIGTSTDPVRIDPTGTTTQPVSGTMTVIPIGVSKATFSAALISYTLPSLATDVFTITGSGTKTIKITEISITFTGSGSVVSAQLVKRSTANSGGTATVLANVPLDSASAAATASVRAYTANPTLGTLVGALRADRTDSPLVSSTTNPEGIIYQFDDLNSSPVVLRGTGEVLAFNLNGVTTGSTAAVYVEWIEE